VILEAGERPLAQLKAVYGLTWDELAALTRCGSHTLHKIDRGRVAGMALGTLVKVALALGCSAVDLVPGLARRPRDGLIQLREARLEELRRGPAPPLEVPVEAPLRRGPGGRLLTWPGPIPQPIDDGAGAA